MREQIIKKLNDISPSKRTMIEQSLCRQLTQTKLWNEAHVIGITQATEIEWNTQKIIERAWIDGKTVTIPKTNHHDKTMDFYATQDVHDLVPGYANILEPVVSEGDISWNKAIDLLIVPGLMFDERGYRLGFGGGFYDRYLAQREHNPITVSIIAAFQLVAKLPVDIYDIPVDYIITEQTCIKCKS